MHACSMQPTSLTAIYVEVNADLKDHSRSASWKEYLLEYLLNEISYDITYIACEECK